MTKNILLVDDTRTVLMFEKMMLNGTGYKVDMALSGMEALEKLDQNAPDLILLDIMMPVMNGIEFCKRVRSNERYAHIPIIIVTTKDDEQMRGLAFEAGCNEFMSKPVNKTELLTKISQFIS